MEEVEEIKKRTRDESVVAESDIDLPEVKRLREELLNSLDDDPEFCSSNQDLDSFMKSFEEEITASAAGCAETGVAGLASEFGVFRPDIGYLLEASDDELGIPPPPAPPVGLENELKTELVPVESDSSDFGNDFWDAPNYDSVGFGIGESENLNCEHAALDGLFDYPDLGFGSGDFSWRPETLPAGQ